MAKERYTRIRRRILNALGHDADVKYFRMNKVSTEHVKIIEQMKKDKSNYVQVGGEDVFYIPTSEFSVYQYIYRLRHLGKEHWKRLKFEQAAGISLSKMGKVYSQLSSQSHLNEADEILSGINPSNAKEKYELIDQIFSRYSNSWHSFAENHKNDERYHLLAEIRDKKIPAWKIGQKKKKPIAELPTKQCAHCGNEREITRFTQMELNKGDERQCKNCLYTQTQKQTYDMHQQLLVQQRLKQAQQQLVQQQNLLQYEEQQLNLQMNQKNLRIQQVQQQHWNLQEEQTTQQWMFLQQQQLQQLRERLLHVQQEKRRLQERLAMMKR